MIEEHVIDVQAKVDQLKSAQKEVRDMRLALQQMVIEGKQGTPEFQKLAAQFKQLDTQLKSSKKEVNELGANFKMSRAQLLEFGENITVVAYGIQQAIKSVVSFGKELHSLAIEGSQVAMMRSHFDKVNGGLDKATEKFNLLKKASGGQWDDKQILSYVNRLDELNFTTKQSTQILDLANEKEHELGIKMDDATDRMTRFIETGNRRGLPQLGISYVDVMKKAEELAKKEKLRYDHLDLESQRQVRLNALLILYGRNMEDIKNKTQSDVDKLESLNATYRNSEIALGQFISKGLLKLEDHLGLSSKAAMDFVVKAKTIGSAAVDILPAIGGLAIALKSLGGTAVLGSLASVSPYIIAIGAAIYTVYDALKTFKSGYGTGTSPTTTGQLEGQVRLNKEVERTLALRKDGVTWDKITTSLNQTQMNQVEAAYQTSVMRLKNKKEEADLDPKLHEKDREHADKKKEEKDALEELIKDIKLQNDLYEITDGKLGKSFEATLNILHANEALADLGKTQQEMEQHRLLYLQTEKDLQDKIWQTIISRTKTEIDALQQLQKLLNKLPVDEKFKPRAGETNKGAASREAATPEQRELTALLKDVNQGINGILSDAMNILHVGTDTFVGSMIDGFQKSLSTVNSILNIFEAIKTVSQTMNAISSIASTLFSVVPGGAIMARAIPRASGGPVYPGLLYEIGERGREAFVPTTSGFIINNAVLNGLMAAVNTKPAITNKSDTYIRTDVDFIRFYRETFPKYQRDVNYRRVK